MAITPRKVKTLTPKEIQWMKRQLRAIDRQIYAHYDGSQSLEVVLPVDPGQRAFVNEALYRRAVSGYLRQGWHIEEGEPCAEGRTLRLSDVSACAPSDITARPPPAPDNAEVAAQRARTTPSSERLGEIPHADQEPTEHTPGTERNVPFEEEVETLWGTGDEDDEDPSF